MQTENGSAKKSVKSGGLRNRSPVKKIFFCTVKNFPQIIQNTRHIIQNMSEII